MIPRLLLLAALTACESGTEVRPADVGTDADADGWSVEEGDCDDADAAVFPGAPETWYDGIDADCSGGSDTDRDGDGADGGPTGADCADTDPLAFPGAEERCNGADDDCDGAVDEDPVDPRPLYTDRDGDGYGAGGDVGTACEALAGTSFESGDCDDDDAGVAPGAVERCDGQDDDCDGLVDDDAETAFSVFRDRDGDGYGDVAEASTSCTLDEGWSGVATDCDDADPLTHPTGAELCDRRDNDCDGTVDEDTTADRVWFPDADGDGHGASAGAISGCDQPAATALDDLDCDDTDAARTPDATETCNGVDDDCDGAADDAAVDAPILHPDADGDGYGDATTVSASCAPPAGWVADASDCDDLDPTVSPLGTESCNDQDDDCDGATDERTAVGTRPFYVDGDLDGYGAGAIALTACWTPHGWADTDTDCDDTDARANPGARERCDSVDNDCDGVVDGAVPDAPTWYADADADGYGAGAGVVSCEVPESSATNPLDCDDTDPAVRPGAAERENARDDDCDVLVDEDWLVAGAVIVTEVARQPYAGGTGTSTNVDVQWFEVQNSGAAAVDLSGWRVYEQDGDTFYLPGDAGLVLEPGGTLVLCYDDVGFADPGLCAWRWGDAAVGAPWYDETFYFDRDEDLVALSAGALLIDEVHWTYDEINGYWPRVAAYSMRLDDAAMDATANDDEANWCTAAATTTWGDSTVSVHDYGTPGAPNGSCD